MVSSVLDESLLHVLQLKDSSFLFKSSKSPQSKVLFFWHVCIRHIEPIPYHINYYMTLWFFPPILDTQISFLAFVVYAGLFAVVRIDFWSGQIYAITPPMMVAVTFRIAKDH